MILNHKIKISLKEFIYNGQFDHLKLGMSRDKVLTVLPQPDEWGKEKEFHSAAIWRYGNFELYFNEDQLYMIFNDYIHSIDGGKHLEVDKWIFDGRRILLSEFILLLINEKVDFEKVTNVIGQVIIKIKGSDVFLSFDKVDIDKEDSYFETLTEEDLELPSRFELHAVYKTKEKYK